jgi:hypothetical protein
MNGDEWKKVSAIIEDRFPRQTFPQRLGDVLGASYLKKLESLSDAQAIEYLKTVDEAELVGAYHVLSKRLSPGVLAEVCREYMTRKTFRTRFIGIGGIGIWLMGTGDAVLSDLLAKIARDPHEHPAIRWTAYQSLERINKGESSVYKALIEDPEFWSRPMSTWIDRIDWNFVDSFLVGVSENERKE